MRSDRANVDEKTHDVDDLLARLDDAGFEPYRDGLRALQLRQKKAVSASKGAPSSRENS